jgi:hypothetical protein
MYHRWVHRLHELLLLIFFLTNDRDEIKEKENLKLKIYFWFRRFITKPIFIYHIFI